MSNQALYRKYRSKKLDQIVGQQGIVSVLKNAIQQDKISHAYLFTGPRGTGKTSIARIFAHEINKAEYKNEDTHLDIIEIDAASNNGVDEMRSLREKINSSPTSLKFKVYIIDEVHMLTPQSFAALLKTIEEPPSHAVFILATTDAHKIPATIMSRVQKFYFQPIEPELIVAHLQTICQTEKIEFEPAALSLIAESSEGSMRDALSLLDQLASSGQKITLELTQSTLGISSDLNLIKLKELILAGHSQQIPNILADIFSGGIDPKALATQIYQQLKLELHTLPELQLLSNLLTLGGLIKPKLGLELTLLQLANLRSSLATTPKTSPNKNPQPKSPAIPSEVETTKDQNQASQTLTVASSELSQNSKTRTKNKTESKNEIKDESKDEINNKTKTGPKLKSKKATTPKTSPNKDLRPILAKDFQDVWPSILTELAHESPSLKALLANAEANLQQETLKLSFAYSMHHKIASEAKNKKLISDCFIKLNFQPPVLELSLAAKKPKAKNESKTQQKPITNLETNPNSDFSDIISLMGGGETVAL